MFSYNNRFSFSVLKKENNPIHYGTFIKIFKLTNIYTCSSFFRQKQGINLKREVFMTKNELPNFFRRARNCQSHCWHSFITKRKKSPNVRGREWRQSVHRARTPGSVSLLALPLYRPLLMCRKKTNRQMPRKLFKAAAAVENF